MWFIGKFSRDERGIGSLVGAAFLILILLSGFAFYMLSVNVTDEYRESLEAMGQLDLKRKQEKIEFVNVTTTDENKLNITMENTGPYQTHLIWLGVFDETAPPSTQNYYELDSYINPAETETGIGSTEMDGEIVEEHQYTIQLITELGNIFIYRYPPDEEEEYATISDVTQIVISNMTAMVGPVLMDFKSLRWYSHESGHNGTWWISQDETKLEWFATITNYGDQDLTLKYESAFAVFSVGKEESYARWKRWYIRQEYLLPVGETVELGFCWNEPNSGIYDTASLAQSKLETCATFLLLIGEWADGTHFGENLPYQAIWVD